MALIIRKPEKKTRNRESVLIVKTVKELRELLGDEAVVKVGRKHFTHLLAKKLSGG